MKLVQQFKEYLLSLTPAPSAVTVKNYIADIKHFISYFQASRQQEFQPELVHALLLQQYKQDSLKSLSASSVERHLSSLRKFFAYLKLVGVISSDPFHASSSSVHSQEVDHYHLKEFKDFLYVYNASNLTIKNYIIDVKQFLSWAEKVTGANNAFNVKEKNVLVYVNSHLVNEYKERLIEQHVFSASSINRKLSSLRKYLAWCASQKLLNAQIAIPDNLNGNSKTISTQPNQLPENNINQEQNISEQREDGFSGGATGAPARVPAVNKMNEAIGAGRGATGPENYSETYSSFPPFRLLQKITNGLVTLLDILLIQHLARLALHGHKLAWKLGGKKLFTTASKIQDTRYPILEKPNSGSNIKYQISNISKELFAPLAISTTHFPWYKKLWHHARYTRPTWYRKYHQLALAHYFNWAILIIIASAIGFGMYSQFAKTPSKSLAALPTAPLRILSFQGRLTDSNDNPITANTWLRFIIYNDSSSTGSARLWEEERKVTPDTDGIFSVLLGSDGSGGQAALCNSGNPPTSPATGACGIPSSLFANNNALWMGVTVESTPELTPRQQLATVAFAANAETLQGLHPITESGAGQTNVVLALDSSGNLTIGGSATPTFTASGGQFTLSGNVLALQTNAGSNSNIQLTPDGSGIIDAQKPLQNSTLNNNITSAAGAVEVDDLFAVLATSSGQSAVTVNQNGSGPIISASASGSPKFTVANSGAVTAPSFFDLDNSSYFLDPAAAGNSLVVNGSVGIGVTNPSLFKLQIAGSIGPDATNTYDLGSSARQWNNIYGNNIYSNGQLLTQLWQRNLGVLSPLNITDDIAVGQTATGTAKFQIFGLTGNATTAGNLTFTGGSASNVIATRNNQGLTIGDSQTGNITFSPLGGSGFLTINAASETVGNAGNYTVQTSSNGGLSLLSSGTGNITLGQNAGLGNVIVQPNAGGNAALQVIKQGPNGDIFTASAGATPEFTIQHDGTIVSGKYTTAGGVLFTTSGGVFTQASNASANTVLHGGSTPSFSAVDLSADVTGTLPINKGGTNTTSIGGNGQVAYSDGSKYVFTTGGSTGNCLQYNSGSAPTWGSCSTGAGGSFWTLDSSNGTLYPINTTLDVFVGGTSTASAKFAVLNMTGSGTPTASVSSGLNGVSAYLTATGTLATTNMQPLVLGTSTTGAINVGTDSTARSITVGNATGATSVTLNAGSGNINFYSTSNKIDSSGNLTLAGTITANNTNTINGLSINSGALSGVTGYTQNSGNFDQSGSSGTFKTGSGAVSLNGDTTIASGKNFTQSGSGTFSTGTGNVSINGALAVDLLPTGNGSINLGSSSHYYNTVYANNFVAPVGNGTSGFWVLDTDLLYPANSFYDLAVGGNATGSATPWQVFATTVGVDKAGTATSSGNLAFRGSNSEVDLLNGTGLNFKQSVGGDSGLASVLAIGQDGNITLANNLAVNGGAITTTNTSATLFNSNATSINIGAGATSGIGIGNASGSNTIHGSVILGDSSGNTINPNGYFSNSIIPSVSNSYDLGSSSNKWKNLYLAGTATIGSDTTITGTLTPNNLVMASTAQYGGFWQRNSGTLSPFNITDDILAGGTGTTSAKFALLNMTGSGNPTASVSSGLNGNGMYFDSTGNIQTVRNQGLTIGGATTGNITLAPLNSGTGSLINLNAKTIDDNQATVTLFGTPTNITLAGAATTLGIGASSGTTTVNNALTITGTTTANGNAVLGASSSNTLNVLASIISSLIPNAADSYNLGSASKEWDTLYVRQIVTPSTGGIGGFWQLSNMGVLAPANLTNDLLIGGGTASPSALADTGFQVFGSGSNVATASTSGNLVFHGTAPTISTSRMLPLVIGGTTTGPIQLSPKGVNGLYINGLGNVGIGTTNPTSPLHIGIDSGSTPDLLLGTGANASNYLSLSAGASMFGYDTHNTLINAGSGTGIKFFVNGTSGTLASGTNAMAIDSTGSVGIGTANPLTSTGLDIEKQGFGNSVLDVNQLGSGDILTASASGSTMLQLTNSGQLYAKQFKDLDDNRYLLDPASSGQALDIAGSAGIGTTSAQYKLDVYGDLRVGKDATNWMSSPAGYGYRRQLTINNTFGNYALINYQVKVVVDTASLITNGRIQDSTNCSDVRFTDTDGQTVLNYWMEPSTCNTGFTTFWVKVPSIQGPNKTIYMYYGASGQSSPSSTTNTFVREISGVNAAYRFDEPTYDPIGDFSGNGNVASASGTTVVAGEFGNARSFNGSTDYIAASNSATLNYAAPFSVGMWFNTTNTSSNGTLLDVDTISGTRNSIILQMNRTTAGQLDAVLIAAGNANVIHSTSTSLADGNWHHVVLTLSSSTGTLTMYVDGAVTGSTIATITGTYSIPNGAVAFGSSTPNVSDGATRKFFYTGSLDEVRFYNSALNSSQVTDLYGNGGQQYGYVTQNNPGFEEIRRDLVPEPTIASLGQEQNAVTQMLPSFYVQQSTGNVALGTLSVASSSALLTVAGDIKSGLYDPTAWIASSNGENYRARITVDDTQSASTSANANYQVKVITNTAAPIAMAKMRSDCNDVRFTDADGQTSLTYWVEPNTCNTTSTIFWVKVPQLPAGQKKNLYMYYGNSSLSSTVSTTNTFVRTIANLQLALPLDETTGSTVTDYSGNGNNGTITGTTLTAGVENNGRYFNGTTSDNISVPTSSSIQFSNNMSFDMWIKPNTSIQPSNADIFSKHGAAANGGYNLESTGTGNTYFFGWSTGAAFTCNAIGGGAGQWNNGGIVLIPGVWQHLAVTKSGTAATAYINGVQVSSCTGSSATIGTGSPLPLYFGRFANSASHLWNGYLDEIHFYSGVLSTAEITDLYGNAAFNRTALANGYATTNSANNLYVRAFTNPEPVTTVDTEQDPSQVDPTLYVNNTFGRVGIGTANPTRTIELVGQPGSSSTGIKFNDSGSGAETYSLFSTNSSSSLGGGLFGLYDDTAGTTRLVVNSSGNVGIGTTNPLYSLDVNGTISTGTSGGNAGAIRIRPSGNNSWFWIDNDNASRLRFSDGGSAGSHFDMGINSNATITVNSTTYTSDERLKKNIQSLDSVQGLNAILKLHPVSFYWKDISSDPNLQLGFIAQDIQQIFPELVEKADDSRTITLPDGTTQTVLNPLGLNYTGLIAPLVMSVQSLDASISAQESQLSSLVNLQLTQTGNIDILENAPSVDFTIPHYYTLSDSLGNPIKQMGAFVELVVGNLRAGSISTQQLFTNSLAIATSNVSIAGQSLHDYIAGIVTSMINNQSSTLNSPIASVDQLHVNLISPLASGSAVALQLDNSGINIQNTNSQQTVARIDNSGNATFSGQLQSQNLAVNGDATISGTLHANRIEANTIAGLQAVVSTLSAQNITNVTNIFFATPSGTPTGENIATGSNGISNGNSQVPTGSVIPGSDQGSMDSRLRGNDTYANIASYSAYLAYIPSLTAETGQFNQGLISLGSTSLADTSIAGQLSINGSLILSDNGVNVLGNDFQIQPLRQGGVSFEGGLLAIDTNGNLTVNGNAVFNKNIAVNTISPLAAGQDVNITLPNDPSLDHNSQFIIHNSSGSAALAIDQLGNIVASGAANIGKLNFALVQPALAVSSTEVVATGSAGTAAIKIHQVEVTIDNPLVTDKSLIYITPVGTTDGIVPYLLRQVPGKSFTVGIPYDRLSDTNFNWLIVN